MIFGGGLKSIWSNATRTSFPKRGFPEQRNLETNLERDNDRRGRRTNVHTKYKNQAVWFATMPLYSWLSTRLTLLRTRLGLGICSRGQKNETSKYFIIYSHWYPRVRGNTPETGAKGAAARSVVFLSSLFWLAVYSHSSPSLCWLVLGARRTACGTMGGRGHQNCGGERIDTFSMCLLSVTDFCKRVRSTEERASYVL